MSIRYSQPQVGPALIDWENPLSRDLLLWHSPVLGLVYNAIGGVETPGGTIAKTLDKNGVLATGNSSGHYLISDPNLLLNGDFSAVIMADHNDGSVTAPLLRKGSSVDSSGGWLWSPNQFGPPTNLYGTNIGYAGPGVYGISSSGGNFYSYANGVYIRGVSPGAPSNNTAANLGIMCNPQGGSLLSANNVGDVFIFGRKLSNAEMLLVTKNPWQLIKSSSRVFKASAASGDVTVALTGISGTASAGTLTPNTSVSTTGTAATGTAGSIAGQGTNLTGQSATSEQGTATPSTDVALTGIAATGEQGTPTANNTVALSGQSATIEQGNVTHSITVALTGQFMTMSQGNLGAVGATTKHGGDDVPRHEIYEKRKPVKKRDESLENIIRQAYRKAIGDEPEPEQVASVVEEVKPILSAQKPKFDNVEWMAKQLEVIRQIIEIQRQIDQENDDEEAILLLM